MIKGRAVRYIVTSTGPDRFGLAWIAQRFVDEEWVADHTAREQAAESVLDRFKRAVTGEAGDTHD